MDVLSGRENRRERTHNSLQRRRAHRPRERKIGEMCPPLALCSCSAIAIASKDRLSELQMYSNTVARYTAYVPQCISHRGKVAYQLRIHQLNNITKIHCDVITAKVTCYLCTTPAPMSRHPQTRHGKWRTVHVL